MSVKSLAKYALYLLPWPLYSNRLFSKLIEVIMSDSNVNFSLPNIYGWNRDVFEHVLNVNLDCEVACQSCGEVSGGIKATTDLDKLALVSKCCSEPVSEKTAHEFLQRFVSMRHGRERHLL